MGKHLFSSSHQDYGAVGQSRQQLSSTSVDLARNRQALSEIALRNQTCEDGGIGLVEQGFSAKERERSTICYDNKILHKRDYHDNRHHYHHHYHHNDCHPTAPITTKENPRQRTERVMKSKKKKEHWLIRLHWQVALQSTRSLAASSPARLCLPPSCTACASLRPTMLWPSPASGTSCPASGRSRRRTARSSP